SFMFFFFQAEDGIRDLIVTGVQTCALPICFERERGLRALLNFGHTFGHAIETGLGYGAWLHGEAVAAGMVMAADLSRQLGLLSEADTARIRSLLERAGLPTAAKGITPARMQELMRVDKKARSGRIHFVLLERLGAALLRAD